MATLTDICVCGHPVSRHELAGTEYARCQKMWSCYCTGGVRVGLRVVEDVERPSGSQTNARFFRKMGGAKKEHPFNAGLRKLVESGGTGYLGLECCDRCGIEVTDLEIKRLTAVYATENGTPILQKIYSTGRNALVCDECLREMGEVK